MIDNHVNIVRFSVPGSVASRQQVLDALKAVCTQNLQRVNSGTSPESFMHQLMSAVGEAFNNIVLHAYGDDNRQPVEVEFATDAQAITAVLRDFGQTFMPDLTPDDPFAGDLDALDLPESGMGMFIMRSFVDELVYQPGPPNAIRLRKLWSRPQRF